MTCFVFFLRAHPSSLPPDVIAPQVRPVGRTPERKGVLIHPTDSRDDDLEQKWPMDLLTD